MRRDRIESMVAREILGASGRPTVEVLAETSSGLRATASVPSGTSRGKYEAFDLRDSGSRFRGMGVRKAAENVSDIIGPELRGMPATDQWGIDQRLIELDGTANKSRLGGNSILAVSVACAKLGAESSGLPLYRYLGGMHADCLPAPTATVLAGGEHSSSDLEFEDYLLIMDGFSSFADSLEALVETRRILGDLLTEKFDLVPDIGGALAPPIADTRHAFDLMLEAAHRAGCEGQVSLGLDVAASELHDSETDTYRMAGRTMSPSELLEYYVALEGAYPLTFIEDPFHEDDFGAFARLKAELSSCLIVGDDLFVTNPERIRRGIAEDAAGAVLLKANQIGTVSETCLAAGVALRNGMAVTASLRTHDTNDDFLADLAVALCAERVKLGSPVRGERNAKFNRLLAIEDELGSQASFCGRTDIPTAS